jgi:hypothetical protein
MRHVTLRCIHIPECRSESESWDLVYQIEDDNHSFVVVMVGWEAHGIQVEEVEE